jgi:hypothetical protein
MVDTEVIITRAEEKSLKKIIMILRGDELELKSKK